MQICTVHAESNEHYEEHLIKDTSNIDENKINLLLDLLRATKVIKQDANIKEYSYIDTLKYINKNAQANWFHGERADYFNIQEFEDVELYKNKITSILEQLGL